MFEVRLDAEFDARHRLRLADGGYEAEHEHRWPVQVVVCGNKTDAMGLLIDFHWLRQLISQAIDPLRGKNLNEHAELGPASPSAEHVARYIAEKLRPKLPLHVMLKRVSVGECPGCWASYIPDRRCEGMEDGG
jgi:6-pyruvoyl-tetrahydropterin synthase